MASSAKFCTHCGKRMDRWEYSHLYGNKCLSCGEWNELPQLERWSTTPDSKVTSTTYTHSDPLKTINSYLNQYRQLTDDEFMLLDHRIYDVPEMKDQPNYWAIMEAANRERKRRWVSSGWLWNRWFRPDFNTIWHIHMNTMLVKITKEAMASLAKYHENALTNQLRDALEQNFLSSENIAETETKLALYRSRITHFKAKLSPSRKYIGDTDPHVLPYD